MSRGSHAANDGSFGRSASGAMVRGVALIVVAVALGIILLLATDGPDPLTPATGPPAGRHCVRSALLHRLLISGKKPLGTRAGLPPGPYEDTCSIRAAKEMCRVSSAGRALLL